MKKQKRNLLSAFWHNDSALLATFYVLPALLVSFTGFRMLFIQHKIFAAISACAALAVLVWLLLHLAVQRAGGKQRAAAFLRTKKPVYITLLLAGALSIFVFAVYTLSPIGDYTVLRMDLYHQYGPLFAELYDKIAQGKSLLYSWNSGGGSGFLGNFLNYLSSPFTLLIFWFSKTEVVTTGISVIVFAKCIACAGTFSYYLNKRFADASMRVPAFSLLYAFSAYFIAYYWNVMWLDAMLVFPLVLMGIERIIDRSNAKLYFCALIYTFLTNYYMAYMVCLFSVVYFIVYYLSHYRFTELYVPKTPDMPKFSKLRQSRLLCSGLRFAFVSVLAAFSCAVVLIPLVKILGSSSATGSEFPNDPELYFDIYDYLAAHFASLEPTIRSSGGDVTPNIYCGIICVILFPLYLMSKRFSWKEKVLHVLLLAGIFAVCNLNISNFVLHGFHFPNDLPYRFSYMYSFILIVCAYKVFRYIRDYNYKTLILVGGMLSLAVIAAQKFDLRYVHDDTIYFTLLFIVVYTLLICAGISKKLSRTMTGVVLCCAVVCEILICDVPKFEFGVPESDYVNDYADYRKELEYIRSNDGGVYRTELNDIPNELRMSPCWYDYEGINCFSSMASENYSRMQYSLGNHSNNINSFLYHTQTPIYNLMFNIKYIVDCQSPFRYNKDYYEYLRGNKENLTTYRNKYDSSIGFAVNEALKKNWDSESGHAIFGIQGEFMHLATGIEDPFFEKVKLFTDGASGCSITSFENEGDGSMSFSVFDSDAEEQASFGMNFTADTTDNYYLYLGSPHDFDRAEIETENYTKTQSIGDDPYILDLGVLQKGEEVKIDTFIDEESTGGTAYLLAVKFNDEAFQKAYDILHDDGMFRVSEKTDTYIKGEYTAKKGEFLYTSITYDEGWKCYVDGVPVKTEKINNALIGVETGEGKHTVEFRYTPAGLKIGALISGVTLGMIAVFFILKKVIICYIARVTDKLLTHE